MKCMFCISRSTKILLNIIKSTDSYIEQILTVKIRNLFTGTRLNKVKSRRRLSALIQIQNYAINLFRLSRFWHTGGLLQQFTSICFMVCHFSTIIYEHSRSCFCGIFVVQEIRLFFAYLDVQTGNKDNYIPVQVCFCGNRKD